MRNFFVSKLNIKINDKKIKNGSEEKNVKEIKVCDSIVQKLEKETVRHTYKEDVKCLHSCSREVIKLSAYEGKSHWQIFRSSYRI